MNLYKTVEPSLSKLKRRLETQGILGVSEMEYVKYLRTVFWKEIKAWVLERDNNRCVVCDAEKSKFCELEVHHRSYDPDVLEGKCSEMLVSLCPRCHTLIEFYPDDSKRTCLHEKDEKYFEIKHLHAEIYNSGLPLQITTHGGRGGGAYEITYTGKNEYLIFYPIELMISEFVFKFYYLHRDELKIPTPFRREKFYQKTGVKVSDCTTGRAIINIKIVDEQPVIKVSKNCTYPIFEYLSGYISEQRFWYIVP